MANAVGVDVGSDGQQQRSAARPRRRGNVISGNTGGGRRRRQHAGSNLIDGNYIGTNAAGTARGPSNAVGVHVTPRKRRSRPPSAAPLPGAGNVISGNTGDGISDQRQRRHCIVRQLHRHQRHRHGRAGQRRQRRRRSSSGSTATPSAARRRRARNVISGNAGDGVQITGSRHDGQRGRGQLHRHRRRGDGLSPATWPGSRAKATPTTRPARQRHAARRRRIHRRRSRPGVQLPGNVGDYVRVAAAPALAPTAAITVDIVGEGQRSGRQQLSAGLRPGRRRHRSLRLLTPLTTACSFTSRTRRRPGHHARRRRRHLGQSSGTTSPAPTTAPTCGSTWTACRSATAPPTPAAPSTTAARTRPICSSATTRSSPSFTRMATAVQGPLDEVGIYNRALSPTEITAIAGYGSGGRGRRAGQRRPRRRRDELRRQQHHRRQLRRRPAISSPARRNPTPAGSSAATGSSLRPTTPHPEQPRRHRCQRHRSPMATQPASACRARQRASRQRRFSGNHGDGVTIDQRHAHHLGREHHRHQRRRQRQRSANHRWRASVRRRANNTIGGTTAADRNVISGNRRAASASPPRHTGDVIRQLHRHGCGRHRRPGHTESYAGIYVEAEPA